MKTPNSTTFAASIATAVLLFSSCGIRSDRDEHTISFVSLNQTGAYTLDGTAGLFGVKSDLLFIDSVSLIIPDIVGNNDVSALRDSIFSAAFDTIGVDRKAIVDNYFDKIVAETGYDASPLSTDSVDIYSADGFNIITGSVTNLTPDLMVYCITTDNYAPRAAHGYTTKRYINYSVDDGRIITLDGIFTPAGLQALPALIAKRAGNLFAVLGPTEISALPSSDNFYISTSEEIVFVYQPYEVASFAQGIIEVPLYPYELSNYMTAYGLKIFGLGDIGR